MKNIIICDLDGTMADIDHRRHFVDGSQKKDWKKFYEGIKDDRPHLWCQTLIESMMNMGLRVIFVSARPETYRKASMRWLLDTIPDRFRERWSLVLVRPEGNFLADHLLKKAWLVRERISGNVLFVVDDRARVVKMWREMGLVALQCDDWEERQLEQVP